MNFRLVYLASGWALLAVPEAQRVEPKRQGATIDREDLVEAPPLPRLRPNPTEVAA